MIKKIKHCALLLLCFGLSATYAQDAVIAAGNNALGSGGSVSYSVGQVVYTTNTGTLGSVSQGVQQTYTISFVGLKQSSDISFSVFPNPFTDNIIVQVPVYKNEKLNYQLFDMQGNLLKANVISGSRTEINTSALPAAAYFLHILEVNKQIQSFNIIKN